MNHELPPIKNENPFDVYLGRGNGIASRMGNRSFRHSIKENRDRYLAAKGNKAKGKVARDIINGFVGRGGLFHYYMNDRWVAAPAKVVLTKVKQALREKKSENKSTKEENKSKEYDVPFKVTAIHVNDNHNVTSPTANIKCIHYNPTYNFNPLSADSTTTTIFELQQEDPEHQVLVTMGGRTEQAFAWSLNTMGMDINNKNNNNNSSSTLIYNPNPEQVSYLSSSDGDGDGEEDEEWGASLSTERSEKKSRSKSYARIKQVYNYLKEQQIQLEGKINHLKNKMQHSKWQQQKNIPGREEIDGYNNNLNRNNNMPSEGKSLSLSNNLLSTESIDSDRFNNIPLLQRKIQNMIIEPVELSDMSSLDPRFIPVSVQRQIVETFSEEYGYEQQQSTDTSTSDLLS